MKIKSNTKKNKLLHKKFSLNNKSRKSKKCNPYKNGPAEWKNPEYIDFSKGAEAVKDTAKDSYYPNHRNLQKYQSEFGQTKNLYDTNFNTVELPKSESNLDNKVDEKYLYNNYYYKNDKDNEYFFNGRNLESRFDINRRNGIYESNAVDADSPNSDSYHYKYFADKFNKKVEYY